MQFSKPLNKTFIFKTEQPKIHYDVCWFLPSYRRAAAIPPFGVFIKKRFQDNQAILNHEMVHWKQYQKMGLFKFYIQYFKEFLIYGYDKMPMETEARLKK